MTTKSYCNGLIFWDGGIDFIRPGENSALQVPNFVKARLRQEFDGLAGTLAAAAVCHYLARAVQFADALRKIAERDQMAVQIADLIFVGLANVEDINIIAAVEALLQLLRRDFRNRDGLRRSFFTANAAELSVVDELRHGRMRAANRTFGILPAASIRGNACRARRKAANGQRASRPCRR